MSRERLYTIKMWVIDVAVVDEKTISRTVRAGRLFSITRNFDVDGSGRARRIIIHVGDREYRIIPTPDTINKLREIQKRLSEILDSDILIEGVLEGIWEKQIVIETKQTEKYVEIQ